MLMKSCDKCCVHPVASAQKFRGSIGDVDAINVDAIICNVLILLQSYIGSRSRPWGFDFYFGSC